MNNQFIYLLKLYLSSFFFFLFINRMNGNINVYQLVYSIPWNGKRMTTAFVIWQTSYSYFNTHDQRSSSTRCCHSEISTSHYRCLTTTGCSCFGPLKRIWDETLSCKIRICESYFSNLEREHEKRKCYQLFLKNWQNICYLTHFKPNISFYAHQKY